MTHTVVITSDTSADAMAVFVGRRVRIDNTTPYAGPAELDRIRRGLSHATQIGTITSAPRHMTAVPGVATDIREEAHGTCRGGWTACYVPYGAVISIVD